MESVNSFWILIVAAFAAGCGVGALLYGAFSGRAKDAVRLKAELDEKEREFNEYKAGVTGHFNKTSELVNELTQDFVKVYQHLSDGARTLGEPRDDMNLLEQQQGRVLINVPAAPAPARGEAERQPGQRAPDRSDETGDGGQGPIDEASREYISETIKEAADIAGEIEGQTKPSVKGGVPPESEEPHDPEKKVTAQAS